jgi:hypothetical protein
MSAAESVQWPGCVRRAPVADRNSHKQRARPHQILAYWSQIVIVSVLLLSQFGISLFTVGGRFVVEAAVVSVMPLIFVNRPLRRYLTAILQGTRFVAGLLMLTVLFGIGALLFQSVVAAYADFRCCVVLLFCYCAVSAESQLDGIKKQVLLHLSIVSTIIGFAAAEVFRDAHIAKVQFNILACAIALYLLAREKRPGAFLFMAGIAAYAAILSFYRTYWLVTGLSCVCFGALLVASAARKGQIKRAFVTVVGLAAATSFAVQSGIVGDYLHSSEKRYIQSIGKTQKLIEVFTGGGEVKGGDDIRIGYFQFILESPTSVLLPHGLGSRAAYGDVNPFFDQFAEFANTADSGFFYIVYHGGLITAIPIFYLFIKRIARRTHRKSTIERMYVLAGLAIFAAYFIPVGDLFVIVERGAFAGAYLGMLVNRNL